LFVLKTKKRLDTPLGVTPAANNSHRNTGKNKKKTKNKHGIKDQEKIQEEKGGGVRRYSLKKTPGGGNLIKKSEGGG